jgi:hypothetical protein
MTALLRSFGLPAFSGKNAAVNGKNLHENIFPRGKQTGKIFPRGKPPYPDKVMVIGTGKPDKPVTIRG